MENLTYENITIVSQAMLKIAYNFWPCIALFVGYCIYETWFMKPAPKRVKNEVR
tara:strand:+ start:73 stop:234 length:162 start_codon:yes stop_codon:yes gene_type:complete